MKDNEPLCQVKCIQLEKVTSLKKDLLNKDEQLRLADIFKALGDVTRLRIIEALSKEELCVCDLAYLLSMTESSISHQLRVLRNLRLVKYRKSGKIVFYSLDDNHILLLFKQGLEHIRHE